MLIPKPGKVTAHSFVFVCVLQMAITEGAAVQTEALWESINNLTVRSKHTKSCC